LFGPGNVHLNVDLYESKAKKVSEIDVLVMFGNRVLVLQAKSKKLTLEARRGNDGVIRDDFRKSVQDAYDQAALCAKALQDPGISLSTRDGLEIQRPARIEEIYPFCVVSDHYPALSFQARQFLRHHSDEIILPPFVMDIFTLDVMAEMLDSPLRFLSYANRRMKYSEKIFATHELIILSYHLKQNLWLSSEHDLFVFHDDIAADLDIAMVARRDGIKGKRTPDGVLTRFAMTALGQMLKTIERHPDPATIDLGFLLLSLGERTVQEVSNGIEALTRLNRKDGKHHDFTIGINGGETGLTIHCNNDTFEVASSRLKTHCIRRKYAARAKTWFGICINPKDRTIKFGVNLKFKWQEDAELEEATKNLKQPAKVKNVANALSERQSIGRNDPCPCGSGKKYKKCCLT
jgi:hypothetical protein